MMTMKTVTNSNPPVRLRTTGLNFEPINMIVLCRRDCMKDDFVRHPGELEGGGAAVGEVGLAEVEAEEARANLVNLSPVNEDD